MVKIENLIQEPIKDRLKEVTSKPKRRRMKPQNVASTEKHRRKIFGEMRALDRSAMERGEIQERMIPVFFICGVPCKRLSKEEEVAYKALGARVDRMKESEAKRLNIK